jgi:hypothetical protein
MAFKLNLEDIFAKGKTGRAISYRDSHLSALYADRWLVNKTPKCDGDNIVIKLLDTTLFSEYSGNDKSDLVPD